MSDGPQQKALYEPFDPAVIKKVGPRQLDYIPVAEVITRMNKVLGTGKWSSQIVEIGRDQNSPSFVICRVSVTAVIDGDHVIADGVGGKEIATKRDSDVIVDLSNDFKSAYSDALKKACQRLGVGLHLARDDEAISQDIESEVDLKDWQFVNGKVLEFSELQLNALKEWWAVNGNTPKPAYETITAELFAAYEAEAKKIAKGVEEAMSVDEIADAVGGTVRDEAPF